MLTVANLSYRYPGAARPAITDLHFTVEPGEIFGFLGPSGAGKSTTQNILIGLLHGYQGTVQVFGRDLAGWGPAYYERVGVAFELPTHIRKLSARRNLAYFAGLYDRPTQAIDVLLERVGLEAAIDEPVEHFSKGMQTRLGLARALLHNPDLLFLDEPTSGLDPLNARLVRRIIRDERAAGRTVVLSTHNMQLADELCDRVALIVDGRIVAIDPPRSLKLRYGTGAVRVEYIQAAGLTGSEFPLTGLADNADFLELLRSGRVQTLHSREATLEEAFVAITGKELA
jgi:fluoroquinolone transport system ATP-binding protein